MQQQSLAFSNLEFGNRTNTYSPILHFCIIVCVVFVPVLVAGVVVVVVVVVVVFGVVVVDVAFCCCISCSS